MIPAYRRSMLLAGQSFSRIPRSFGAAFYSSQNKDEKSQIPTQPQDDDDDRDATVAKPQNAASASNRVEEQQNQEKAATVHLLTPDNFHEATHSDKPTVIHCDSIENAQLSDEVANAVEVAVRHSKGAVGFARFRHWQYPELAQSLGCSHSHAAPAIKVFRHGSQIACEPVVTDIGTATELIARIAWSPNA